MDKIKFLKPLEVESLVVTKAIEGTGGTDAAISAHNSNTSAHADIREQISQLSAKKAVLYNEQDLTEEQKAQARTNIGAVKSWDDLADKPVVVEGGDTLTWDGNTEGLVSFEASDDTGTWYKISDVILEYTDVANGVVITTADGSTVKLDSDSIIDMGVQVPSMAGVVVLGQYAYIYPDADFVTNYGLESGIFVCGKENVRSLTIPGYTGFTQEKIAPSHLYQPDWNQTDSTAPDYIKNRTHWAEPPVTTTTVLLPESTIEFEEGWAESEVLLPFTENTEYTVTWDGVEYTSVSKCGTSNGMNFIVFGNTVQLDGEDNGQPFIITYITNANILGISTIDGVTASHTVSITKVTTTQEIHKLDDKYINAEWLPQKTIVSTVGVVETTMTVKDTGEDMLPSESYDMNALVSAEYCNVLWNGTTYKCVPKQIMSFLVIGNASMLEPTIADSGEPFLFVYGDFVGGVAIMVPAETEATFSITCYNSAVASTMPYEYLPEPLQFGYEHEAEIHKEAITWDGDTTGRATLKAFLPELNIVYHVSSAVPTFEDLCNGGVFTVSQSGMSHSGEFTSSDVGDMTDGNRFIFSIKAPCFYIVTDMAAQILGVPAGIYFANFNGSYVSSFTINNCTFVEKETKIKTIDPKYLPEGIGGGSGLPEVVPDDEGAFLRVVNGEWKAVVMPSVEEGEF